MKVHKVYVDTSKYLERKRSSSARTTPIPNGVARQIPRIAHPTQPPHTRTKFENMGATALSEKSMSTLRRYTTDTEFDLSDESLEVFSDDDTHCETFPSTPFPSLEDLRPQKIEFPPYMTGILCSPDNKETFDTETAKQYCHRKILSNDTTERDSLYYQTTLYNLNKNFRPESPYPMRKILNRSPKKSK